jgi:two-component system, OmpR family, response regulator
VNLAELTGYVDEVFDRSFDAQILRLRRKIERDPSHPGLIRTARREGYLINAVAERVR